MSQHPSLVPCTACDSRACRMLPDPRWGHGFHVLRPTQAVPRDCPLLVRDDHALRSFASRLPSRDLRNLLESLGSYPTGTVADSHRPASGPDSDLQRLLERSRLTSFRLLATAPGQAFPAFLLPSTGTAPLPQPPSAPSSIPRARPEAKASSAAPKDEKPVRVPIHVLEVPDLHFSLGSPVPLLDESAALVKVLVAALRYAKEEAASTQGGKLAEKLVVCGHCDTSGKQRTNYKLSQQRAQMVKALLDQNPEGWKTLAAKHGKVGDFQQILRSLYVLRNWPCDPGEVDGIEGPVTRAAVEGFQQECNDRYGLGLAVDGEVGPETWAGIHRALCGLVSETMGKPDAMTPSPDPWEKPLFAYPEGQGAFGCGESFPTKDAGKDEVKASENRRVELLFVPVQITFKAPSNPDVDLTPAECPAYDPEKAQRKIIPIPALPEVLEIYWSYGPDHVRLTDISRHYVDMNIHLVTSNYAPGDRIAIRIHGDNNEPLFGKQKSLTIQGQVDANGEAVIENVFSDKSLNLEWE